MNTIDTIYLTGDLIAEKLCGCKEAMPIIIQQTKEPCCFDNAEMLAWIICGAVVAVAFLIVAGWLIRHKMDCCMKVMEAENKRKEQERDSLIKLKQEYESKVLNEFASYKKVVDFIQEEKKKQSSAGQWEKMEGLLSESTEIKYAGKLEKYMNELNDRISKLNKELGIKTIEDKNG